MAMLSNLFGRSISGASLLAFAVFGGFLLLAPDALSQGGPQGGGGGGGGGGGQRPSSEMLAACEDLSSGDSCTAAGASGTCYAPSSDRPLACVPEGGQGERQARRGGRRGERSAPTYTVVSQWDTQLIGCQVNIDDINTQLNLPTKASWWCVNEERILVGNGVPDHAVGDFPNAANRNAISAQHVRFSAPLTPSLLETTGQRIKEPGVALNGIKFDPGTGGRCPSSVTSTGDCDLGRGMGPWTIEALGQDTFDFGEDGNNAHVQPTGAYHYHGVPEAMLTDAAKAGEVMALVGWAVDGFPIYARFGHVRAQDASSALRVMTSSYQLKATPDAGRPDIGLVPMGTFTQDYAYVAGSGDLDECNGRVGVTPQFPGGIYHYYATDTFPFVQRCIKGVAPVAEQGPRRERAGEEQRGRQGGQRRRRRQQQ